MLRAEPSKPNSTGYKLQKTPTVRKSTLRLHKNRKCQSNNKDGTDERSLNSSGADSPSMSRSSLRTYPLNLFTLFQEESVSSRKCDRKHFSRSSFFTNRDPSRLYISLNGTFDQTRLHCFQLLMAFNLCPSFRSQQVRKRRVHPKVAKGSSAQRASPSSSPR